MRVHEISAAVDAAALSDQGGLSSRDDRVQSGERRPRGRQEIVRGSPKKGR